MPLQIIHAGINHAAVIATIGKKSFRNSFGNLFNCKDELFEYLEHTYNPVKLASSIRKDDNIYLLAYLNGDPVGFAKIKKHSLNDQIESIAQMELQKIYVLSESQCFGVGTALMIEIKNLAREVCPDYIWLDTYVSNEKGIRFYEKNGFSKMGKFFFTIGTQSFEYHLMAMQVAPAMKKAC